MLKPGVLNQLLGNEPLHIFQQTNQEEDRQGVLVSEHSHCGPLYQGSDRIRAPISYVAILCHCFCSKSPNVTHLTTFSSSVRKCSVLSALFLFTFAPSDRIKSVPAV